MSCNKRGNQKPRHAVEPPRLDSDGKDASELTCVYGFKLDEWQDLVLESWLGRDSEDKYTATSCGLSVPRQNGKNAILEARELYGLCVNGEKILHTAHRVDTARKSFLRLVRFFDERVNPDLAEMVEVVRRTNGQEAITLINGGSIEFSSRVNGGARGSTYDVVVFDEAQELTDDQMESILSTVSASPSGNRQLIFTGTPPSPVSPGTVFKRKRAAALNGEDLFASWHEWSVAEVGDINDRDRWYETNPALGVRLDENFTATECATLSESGFARERLGWWEEHTQGVNPAIKKHDWKKTGGVKPELTDKAVKAFGVRFTSDSECYALAGAVKEGDMVFIEGIAFDFATGSNIAKIAKWLIERKDTIACIAIDGKGNADTLQRKLIEGGVAKRAIRRFSTQDAINAPAMFVNALDEKTIIHPPEGVLTDSALAAQKRNIGKTGGWGFGDGTEPCALVESASIAHYAVKTTKRRPGRKVKLV